MNKKEMPARKRLRVPTQKMKDRDNTPQPDEQTSCFAFVRWEDGYTGKILSSFDILARDEGSMKLQDLRSGDPILARWSDGKFYKATVEYVSEDDQSKQQKGSHGSQKSFLNFPNENEPLQSSGSDTIIINRSPFSERGEEIAALNPSPDGGHATGRGSAGSPQNGSNRRGTTGPSSHGVHILRPSTYGLNASGPPRYGHHTPSPTAYGLNPSGSPPHRRHTPSPSQQQAENEWTPCDGCKEGVEKILEEKRRIDEVLARIDPDQVRELQGLLNIIGERHQESPSSPSGQQELFPGSGVFISSFRLAAFHHASKPSSMRLFHALFDHFFSIEDCQNAVPFGRPGTNPLGKEGKRILDRKKVNGILTYVLRCATLPGWIQIEEAKLKKAFVNKCRARAGCKQ